MKNNKFRWSALLALTLVMGGCSSIKYAHDMDNTIDFTKYKTYQYYGWAEESNKILNQLEQRRIESAFGAEFDKRNLEYVKEGGDLIVTLFIVTENKTRTSATTTNMGGGMGYGYGGWYGYGPAYGWGGGTSHTTFSEYDYTVGTLVIDIYDAEEKRLIFESVAKGETHDNPKGQDERIKKLAAQMMKSYPVAPTE